MQYMESAPPAPLDPALRGESPDASNPPSRAARPRRVQNERAPSPPAEATRGRKLPFNLEMPLPIEEIVARRKAASANPRAQRQREAAQRLAQVEAGVGEATNANVAVAGSRQALLDALEAAGAPLYLDDGR